MKHIILTGASRGFGQALATQLASEDIHLHLVARSDTGPTEKQVAEKGGQATGYQHDLTVAEERKRFMQSVFSNADADEAEYFGLVNNAGTLHPIGPLGKYDADDYNNNLQINFVAPALLTHRFIQRIQDLDVEKRVVFISSGAARKPYQGWTHYCSTKAGIDMLMQTADLEQRHQDFPVRMMGFNPGRIETEMQEVIRSQNPKDFPQVQDFIDAKTDGRTKSAEEQAAKLAEIMLSDRFPSGEVVSR